MNDRNARSYSIRTCLLIGVNVPLILASAVFLTLDYRNMLVNRIADKRVALDEEARVLLSAIEVSGGDAAYVQQLIDLACGRMQDAASPGHHIAVQLGSHTLQAYAHHRASPEYFDAMQHAASLKDRQAEFDGRATVVGVAGEREVIVYVLEYVANAIRSIRMQLLVRLIGGVVVTLLILTIINIILTQIIIKPLGRLSATVHRIGGGALGARVGSLPSRELQLVADSINEMSCALAEVEKNRQAQMNKARKIQQNLQPPRPDLPGLSLHYVIHSADDVGGDFIDFVQIDAGITIVCVADVTGHGVPAAMGAAMLKVLFDKAIERAVDPGDILASMNRAFHRVALEGDFATAAAVSFSPDRSRCHYASAGHDPMVLLRADGTLNMLESTGLVLGIDPEARPDVCDVMLNRGDRVVIYTDGLVEAVSPADEQFGRERLIQLIIEHHRQPVATFCEAIMAGVKSFVAGGGQRDDMTLLVIDVPDNT